MCGLFGVIGPGITHTDLDVLRELAYVSGLRGQDSTGVVQGYSPSNGNVKDILIEKSNFDVNYFTFYHKYVKEGNSDVFSGIGNNFFLGHVRAATRGSVSKENAHPFDVGNIVGMHNGTLVDSRYFHAKKTDSELLLQDIEENGLEETLKKLDPKSAYAIVYIEKDTGSVVFARNNQRSLFFCRAENRSVIYYASEAWMLRGVLSRNHVKIMDNSVWWFTDDVIYRMHPREITLKKDPFTKRRLYPAIAQEEKDDKKTTKGKSNKVTVKGAAQPKEKPSPESLKNLAQKFGRGVTLPQVSITKKTEDTTEKKEDKKPKIPKMFCCGCQKPLSLADRYFGKKFAANAILCESCNSFNNNVMIN